MGGRIAMSHSFQVPDDLYTELATYAARRGQSPDVLLMDLVKEGVEQLKQTDSMAALRKIPYDPAHDPLARSSVPLIAAMMNLYGRCYCKSLVAAGWTKHVFAAQP
jgi:hypothetical protein